MGVYFMLKLMNQPPAPNEPADADGGPSHAAGLRSVQGFIQPGAAE